MGPLVSGDRITSKNGPRYVSGVILDHSAMHNAVKYISSAHIKGDETELHSGRAMPIRPDTYR